MFKDATLVEVEDAMHRSCNAFKLFQKTSLSTRAALMRTIAKEIEALGDRLIEIAMSETHLPEGRLKNERARTMHQLVSYAAACERGDWLNVSICTSSPDRVPPRPDIRKTMTPLGPVVVFGSSNFPFAYSTAGGDTACALAAGCSVVVKAHPAHPETSECVAQAVARALEIHHLPKDVFIHLHGASFSVGEALVKDPHTQAVGFTGSYSGGMALFNWAQQRKQPIPVFAEMGSVNPVFLFNQQLSADVDAIAQQYADSITLGVGQFCTNPGIIIGLDTPALHRFKEQLAMRMNAIPEGKMLHDGIAKAYEQRASRAMTQKGITVLTENSRKPTAKNCTPLLLSVTASNFLENTILQEEVFGPASLIVVCNDATEMKRVAASLDGQLTSTVIATAAELKEQGELLSIIQQKCGRIIFNGVPTGVEVCQAMQHGGPFPATTDSRFTSVGPDGIRRFARPIAFQNFPDELLPDELKAANPLNVNRTIE